MFVKIITGTIKIFFVNHVIMWRVEQIPFSVSGIENGACISGTRDLVIYFFFIVVEVYCVSTYIIRYK